MTIPEFSDQRKLLEVVKVCKKRVVGGIASLSLEWRAIDPDLQVCSLNTFFSCLVFLNSWCPEVEVICSSCISVAQGVSRLFLEVFTQLSSTQVGKTLSFSKRSLMSFSKNSLSFSENSLSLFKRMEFFFQNSLNFPNFKL